jgi:hypothetical protein
MNYEGLNKSNARSRQPSLILLMNSRDSFNLAVSRSMSRLASLFHSR